MLFRSLLAVEIQEERERHLRALLLAFGVGGFCTYGRPGLLGGHRDLALGLFTRRRVAGPDRPPCRNRNFSRVAAHPTLA